MDFYVINVLLNLLKLAISAKVGIGYLRSQILKDKMNWLVYILECSDRTYYCGITNNIEKRIKTHNKGTASKYTRVRLPVKLIAKRANLTHSEALKLEHKVKQQKKDEKVEFLIGS